MPNTAVNSSTANKAEPDNSARSTPHARILFLHHSTGRRVWNGGKGSLVTRITRRLCKILGWQYKGKSFIQSLFIEHNRRSGTDYRAEALVFPKEQPYGWDNYPFDYYNIWVRNAGTKPFREEPTLELLTREYQVIMLKHCFPVSNIQPDRTSADINSDYKSLANYRLQYLALRKKFQEFPNTKFIVWTGAAQVKLRTNEEEAKRAREFFDWVTNEWDLPNDNIFVWDFYRIQTEGHLYFLDKFAQSERDSHPNSAFGKLSARMLFQRMLDVIETAGAKTDPTGAFR